MALMAHRRLDPNDRVPDPERMLSAYFHSTTTLNYVRGLLTSGFASLDHPREWSLSHVRSPGLRWVSCIAAHRGHRAHILLYTEQSLSA